MEKFCENCDIRLGNSLKELDVQEISNVCREKDLVYFKKKDFIFKEKQAARGVFCIQKGVCKITKLSSNGEDQIVSFAKRGALLGYSQVIDGKSYHNSAQAIEEVLACFIPKNQILQCINSNTFFTRSLMKKLQGDLKKTESHQANLKQKNVMARLATTLLFLGEEFGTDRNHWIAIELSRKELANLVDTSAESVIRLLSNLKNEKIIALTGKKIQLIHEKKLKNIATGFN